MASLNNAVSISLAVQDSVPRGQDFGVILVVCSTALPTMATFPTGPDGLSAMGDEGLDVTDTAYEILSQMSSVSPTVSSVKFWPREVVGEKTMTIEVASIKVGKSIGLTFEGIECYVVPETGDDTDSVATDLAALINAVDGFTAAAGTDALSSTITITADADGDWFNCSAVTRRLLLQDTSEDQGIAAELAEAQLEDPDFLGVYIDSSSPAEIAAAAAWCAANKKILFVTTPDSDIGTSATDDVVSTLGALSNVSSFIMWTHYTASHTGARLAARQLSTRPGTSTAAHKNIGGGTDDWTPTQISNAKAKNAIMNISLGGASAVHLGRSPGGRPLDLQRGVLFFESIMQLSLVTKFLTSEKIPYSPEGIADLRSAAYKVGLAEEGALLLPGSFKVTALKYEDTTVNNRIERVYTGLSFTSVVQGAIETLTVNGTFTL